MLRLAAHSRRFDMSRASIFCTVSAIASVLLLAPPSTAQRPVELAPNAPQDKPVDARLRCQWEAATRAMAPYVAQARASYPEAKRRFLAGLPPRHTFFVTARLQDTHGRTEQVFIAVDSLADGQIVGRIWSNVALVQGFRFGQRHMLAESEFVDWLIARPDGTEEGNVVGKFLDTYSPPAACADSGKTG
jgi:hypothetical protein